MTDDQTNDAFAEIIFGADENVEWADKAAAEAADLKPEPKPLKESGLSYVDDVVLKFGAVESRYAFTWKGKILFYAHVELGCVAAAPAGIKHPHAISWHPIVIKSVDGMKSISTNGVAVVAPHEGEPAHVDGMSVMSYVLPHAMDYMVKLYAS